MYVGFSCSFTSDAACWIFSAKPSFCPGTPKLWTETYQGCTDKEREKELSIYCRNLIISNTLVCFLWPNYQCACRYTYTVYRYFTYMCMYIFYLYFCLYTVIVYTFKYSSLWNMHMLPVYHAQDELERGLQTSTKKQRNRGHFLLSWQWAILLASPGRHGDGRCVRMKPEPQPMKGSYSNPFNLEVSTVGAI